MSIVLDIAETVPRRLLVTAYAAHRSDVAFVAKKYTVPRFPTIIELGYLPLTAALSAALQATGFLI